MKIAILGYGKMGKTIERLAQEKGHEIVFKKDAQIKKGALEEADVAIEFSTPESAFENIENCMDMEIPVVSGTTGWLDRWDEMINICEKRNGSFIYASNFSIGVNLFFNLNEYAAKLMEPWKEYDVSLKEIHHTEKKDAPSGTAISLAEGIIKHSDKANWELDAKSKDTLKISAERIADVKGIHEVEYSSEIDNITIKHEAHSREGFAKGAILAAEWLIGKKGVFTMKDVLDLK
ncbi:MAG: 4-hydroxy-tetrahydrodipicolinate reductase [Flavobacteriaceae bacterium]|nr:4-hydroxy-tetrahydrodipicolinate reductase [Flavobacteriaceae bacterium]